MSRRQNWGCWVATQSISEQLVESFLDGLETRGSRPFCEKSEPCGLKCWQISVESKLIGEIRIYTRTSEYSDDGDENNVFEASFFCDDERLGTVLRDWIAQHSETFVEKVGFQNQSMMAIADCVLQQSLKEVRVSYEPQTEQNHLKKLEFDLAERDVRALVNSPENTNRALSDFVLPYLHAQTGIRCDTLPISEIRIRDRIVVTPRSLTTLDGDGSILATVIGTLLELFNAQYQQCTISAP
ncbi:LAME_0E05688g1_1 [Lachancea meyersii CBS 8951]|uniref:LAME_0E05688g1_1 n=1 Tax=Lachancea meyersii CBS 8951 TaxID=1266667 RepID=A0A1G4JHJ8_9SACH|nr:LAME_0E05688g1_1 [Lachancea meyersii CBS 8951]